MISKPACELLPIQIPRQGTIWVYRDHVHSAHWSSGRDPLDLGDNGGFAGRNRVPATFNIPDQDLISTDRAQGIPIRGETASEAGTEAPSRRRWMHLDSLEAKSTCHTPTVPSVEYEAIVMVCLPSSLSDAACGLISMAGMAPGERYQSRYRESESDGRRRRTCRDGNRKRIMFEALEVSPFLSDCCEAWA